MNRVKHRHHLMALLSGADWESVRADYGWTPRFVLVNGCEIIDWTAVPWNVRAILKCGGKMMTKQFMRGGGVYDPSPPRHLKQTTPRALIESVSAMIPRHRRCARPSLAENIPIRFRLYNSQKGHCFYCAKFVEKGGGDWIVEHKIPISRGGDNSDGNLVGSCRDCDSRKGSMTADEFIDSEILGK